MENLPAWLMVAVAASGWVYTFISNRSKVSEGKVSDLAARVDKTEDRVLQLESHMEHLPDKDTTYELRVAITELNGQVQLLGERIRPIAAISDRLQEAIIEKATAA